MGSNEKNEIFRQMRKEPVLRFSNGPFGGLVTLNEIPFAVRTLSFLSSSDRIIIAKPRQMLMSTLLLAHAIKLSVLGDEHKTVFVLHNSSAISSAISKLRNILDCSGIEADVSARLVKIGTSEIRFTSASSHSLAGYSCDTLILDECAYFKKLDDDLGRLFPVLKNGGQLILSSTPRKDSFFNLMFLCEDNFTAKRLSYSENPYITEERIQKMLSVLSVDTAKEEIYCEVVHKLVKKETKMVTFRLDETILGQVQEKIKRDNISLTDYLTRLIKADLST